MEGKKTGKALPLRLKKGVERFESWRATRRNRRIPEALWKVAEGLASEFGIHQTSRALRLNAKELKRRWTASPEAKTKQPNAGAEASSFVPLMGPGLIGGEGAAEYKGVDGSWLRVEWKGASPDLGRLSESFFFGGRS